MGAKTRADEFAIGDRVNVGVRQGLTDQWRPGTIKSKNPSGATVKLDGGGERFAYWDKIRHVPKEKPKPWRNPEPLTTLGEAVAAKGVVVPLRHFEPKEPIHEPEPAPTDPQPWQHEPPAAPRGSQHGSRTGVVLPGSMTAFLVAKVSARGVHEVAQLLQDLDPHAISTAGTIRTLCSKPDHRWSRRNHGLLVELAKSLGYVEPAPRPRVAPVVESPESEGASAEADPVTRALTTAIQAAVAAGLWTEVADLSKELRHREAHVREQVREQEPAEQPKPFHDLRPVMQRQILWNMHSRIADKLRAQGLNERPLAAAWRTSYEAFEKESGKAITSRASRESDTSGVRMQPLDIIEREGELVRFWDVVRRTWEGV
jgi:hypothetical protein